MPTEGGSVLERVKTKHATRSPMPENIRGDVIETRSVPAGPVKRFFIDILTRDIELVAAILDLVDNSVDSAMEIRPNLDFTGLEVSIEANEDRFSIADNCGGISVEAASTYVFRMGRPEDAKELDSSIGQFGVGMKRALFKIGNQFLIESSTGSSHFTVELDVDEWEEDPEDWDFKLDILGPGPDGFPQRGTWIIIEKLHKPVVEALKDMVEQNQLRDELRSTHRMAIERGLRITLNGEPLAKTPTVLYASPADDTADANDKLVPLIERFTVEDEDGRPVEVEIYAGVFDDKGADEDAEPEDVTSGAREAGWYVFGNDRLLLAADKTPVTGWGGGAGNMPLFHNQFAKFRGYVYMRAKESIALPWNTTKTGVETSDRVWLRVRGEMIKAGREVIQLLNYLKLERRALKAGDTEVRLPILDAIGQARPVSTANLVSTTPRRFSYVTPNPDLAESRDGRRISYAASNAEFDAVAEMLGTSKPSEVGRGTFDYFIEREVSRD